ncbi:hypothetical protein K0B03_03400, partial [Patescibacteria group bacterium]|nr:hypothetical protein [Patescibacteria group bacterium]
MIKKFLTFSLILFILIWFAFSFIEKSFPNFDFEQIPQLEKKFSENLLKEIDRNINTPSPLVSRENSENSYLTKAGVLNWTNIQRDETESFSALLKSNILDEIAMARLEDMFAKQYFEHISPEGFGASDIAKDVNYEYISIGENIALGNFKDDQTLVQAWMDSPGHRANILNTSYTEIGIAVKKGSYENHQMWIGVQIFGRPFSDCPKVNQNLKTEIENNQNQISNLEKNSISL